METEKIMSVAANVLNNKKAKDLNVLKIDELSSICNYFVIATATSSTHVRALADEVEEVLKQNGVTPHHIEGKSTGWIVLDYISVIVHIFTNDQREFFALDKMWSNGEKADLDKILDNVQGD